MARSGNSNLPSKEAQVRVAPKLSMFAATAKRQQQAVDDFERGETPTDGDADDERVGASETLRNNTGSGATPWKQHGCCWEH